MYRTNKYKIETNFIHNIKSKDKRSIINSLKVYNSYIKPSLLIKFLPDIIEIDQYQYLEIKSTIRDIVKNWNRKYLTKTESQYIEDGVIFYFNFNLLTFHFIDEIKKNINELYDDSHKNFELSISNNIKQNNTIEYLMIINKCYDLAKKLKLPLFPDFYELIVIINKKERKTLQNQIFKKWSI